MKQSKAIEDNHTCFPRVIHNTIEKTVSATINAAINHDAWPVIILVAISVQLTSICLINSFGIAIKVVKMKYGINSERTMLVMRLRH